MAAGRQGGPKDLPPLRPGRAGGGVRPPSRWKSDAKSDRAGLRRVLDGLDAGDVLMVTRLDRLRDPPAIFSTRLPSLPTGEPDSAPLATHGPTRRPRTGG